MFLFGHLGIGLKLVSPWSRHLSKRIILLGTILPDLIDKPLYYGLSWLAGKSGADLGMIAGTRSFGHTAALLIVMTLTASAFRLRWLAALSLGVATHLLLDNVGDRLVMGPAYTAKALVWPWMGWQFPVFPFHGMSDHASRIKDPYVFLTEIAGALILFWEYWKSRRRKEIAHWIRLGRAQNRGEGLSPWQRSTMARSKHE